MQAVHCPVCKSEPEGKGIERHQKYTLYMCPVCDLQWWHPMENPSAAFYEERWDLSRDVTPFADKLTWDHRQFFKYLPVKGGKLLDIGCKTGHFLHEVRRKGLASQTVGLDFDRKAVETAKSSFGLDNVFAMSLEEFCDRNYAGGFDVITAFQVLEHQWDPVAFLGIIRRLLKPGGHVVLGVPNRNMWGAPLYWDYPPMHLTRWSDRALRTFLERNGFSVTLTLGHPVSISEARSLISAKIRPLRYMEDAVATGLSSAVTKDTKLTRHPALQRLAFEGLGLLRPLRRGVLLAPTLLLWAIGRATLREGREIFCIAVRNRQLRLP